MNQTIATLLVSALAAVSLAAQTDPGPRRGPALSGRPLAGLTTSELSLFQKGKEAFEEIDDVADGLGPRFNLDSCQGCHSQPVTGGTSPAINPQVAMATKAGALNQVPDFIRPDGPVRVVRPRRGGGVLSLFVITGRADSPSGCNIQQPDFQRPDLTFRIPTPVFGLGLVEAIPDSTLRANFAASEARRRQLGIQGRFNTNGNDGTITRFGWKAQNKSLTIFSGEAYNVEVGVTNELFPQEREEDPACAKTASPESHTEMATGEVGDVELFSMFMKFLAPPMPAQRNPMVDRGAQVFDQVGCAACHTPMLETGLSTTAALSRKPVRAYSDFALHRMGQALNDGIQQGDAQGQDWRTAPLWGLGDRIFLLHDGRTKDLTEAIRLHESPGSEATQTVRNFNTLPPEDKQALLAFLRSM